MKRLKRHFLLTLFVIALGVFKSQAQIDTVFWFAAPWVTPDHDDNVPMKFHFSTFNNTTTVRLRQPAGTYDTTFTVAPNTLFSKDLAHIVNDLESKPANTILNSGFEITSDYPMIAVYDFLSNPNGGSQNNPETYSLKGQNGMGYEFVTPFQTLWNNQTMGTDRNGDGFITQPKQMFCIVATEDNTVVQITPRCAVVGGHPANVTYTVVLPLAGNVYTCENLVQNTSVAGNSLAGSIVVADKPVSVTVSDDSVNPSGGGGCYDLMGDQIVPVDVIGQDYIVNLGNLNAGSNESAFIVATDNFTTVTMQDGVTTTTVLLNQGDTYPFSITEQLSYIQADKNVYVLHMSGYGCELGEAILPPLNCSGSDQVSFPRTNDDNFLLNVLCPAGAEGSFTVNGDATVIQATDFTAVPGTGGAWMGAQVDIPLATIAAGSSNTILNSTDLFSFGIINGTASGGCLYHYLSTFLRRVTVTAGDDQNVCSSENVIDLSGTVSGGTIYGEWSVLNGSGTLNTPTNLTTTYDIVASDYSQGYLDFVLSSTGNCDPQTDTMRVTFIQSAEVDAGTDVSYCKNNVGAIPISGSKQYSIGSEWSGGNGGAFGNIADLNTTYTPSPADLANDSVVLYLSSTGSYYSCPEAVDSITIYFTDPPVVTVGPDMVICATETEVPISATVSGASTTGIWTTTGSGAFSPSETDLSTDYLVTSADTTVGNLTLYLTSTNNGNCLAVTDSIQVNILDQPNVAITTEDSTCANVSSIALSGTVTTGYNVLWTVYGSGSIADNSSINTIYTINPVDTVGGYLDIVLATNGGACPTEKDSMRLTFVAPPVVNAGLDVDFCDNELVQLNGTMTGTASSSTWTSTGTGTFSPSNALLDTYYQGSAADVANGSVMLILTSSEDFGCTADKDTLIVTYKESPIADYVFTSSCEGEQTDFTDLSTTGTGTIDTWTYNFGDGITSLAQNSIHIYNASGLYNTSLVVGASNGCYDTAYFQVNVNPNPVPNFSVGNICEGQTAYFIDNSFLSSGNIVSYSWSFEDDVEYSTAQNPSYVYDAGGSYALTLTVTSDSGCVGTLAQNMTVLFGPDVEFSMIPNPALVLEDVTYTDLTSPDIGTQWDWDFGDGVGGNAQNETHSYTYGGTFDVTLTVTDTAGCISKATNPIEIILSPALPTAFTPNGDGENDVFIIRGGPFDAVDFKIYNNWGQLIFQSDEAANGWDGTFKGKDAPMGVYTWTYTVIIGDKTIVKEGDVTLLR